MFAAFRRRTFLNLASMSLAATLASVAAAPAQASLIDLPSIETLSSFQHNQEIAPLTFGHILVLFRNFFDQITRQVALVR